MEKYFEFLGRNNLQSAQIKPLQGDASHRRYERIIDADKSYMLMIAPPSKEDVKPFIRVDQILRECGLNAPKIIDQDVENGYLLLEDFGDDSYSKVLRDKPSNELELYRCAIDVLGQLPEKADIPSYSTAKLLEEAALLTDWLLTDANRAEYLQIWEGILAKLDNSKKVLVMRDYHADNLMWMPQRNGLERVGLLDFQDALLGHPAYDYVSLLEDARRDVDKNTVRELLKDKDENFIRDYHILGAQRNCKIVGIFHRLNKRDGKEGYLKFLPRVWAHLHNDLKHPALEPMKLWLERSLIDKSA
jgi:hypothetical protein